MIYWMPYRCTLHSRARRGLSFSLRWLSPSQSKWESLLLKIELCSWESILERGVQTEPCLPDTLFLSNAALLLFSLGTDGRRNCVSDSDPLHLQHVCISRRTHRYYRTSMRRIWPCGSPGPGMRVVVFTLRLVPFRSAGWKQDAPSVSVTGGF